MILDCQNEKSTLESVAKYFNTDVENIKETLLENNFEKLFERYCNEYDYFDNFLYDCFMEKFGVKNLEYVMWFHLSRSLCPNDYYEGILLLNVILPKIQKDLYALVSEEIGKNEWQEICQGAGSGFRKWRYNMKISDKCHYGPYAMLVREIAFNSETVGNHNYLNIPEIIEDMCMNVKNVYDVDILDRFIRCASPVIVKFKEQLKDNTRGRQYIGTALTYLHNKLHGKKLCLMCNTCYSGYGSGIQKNNIISVEVLERNEFEVIR